MGTESVKGQLANAEGWLINKPTQTGEARARGGLTQSGWCPEGDPERVFRLQGNPGLGRGRAIARWDRWAIKGELGERLVRC